MDDQHLSEEPQPNEPPASVPPPPPVDPRFGIPPQQTPEELKRKRSDDLALGWLITLVLNFAIFKIGGSVMSVFFNAEDSVIGTWVLALLLNLATIIGSFTVLKRPYIAYGIISLLVLPLLLFGFCMAVTMRP